MLSAIACALVLTQGIDASDLIGAAALLGNGPEVEKLIGQLSIASLEQEYDVVQNGRQYDFAQSIFQRLVSTPTVKAKRLPYRLSVFDNQQFNAFAVPGGQVGIFSPILELPGVKSGEIAFVQAHELGHTIARHGLNALKEKFLLRLGLKALSRNKTLHEIAGLAGAYICAQHSQKDEFEADQIGLRILIEAGYEPLNSAALMARLSTLERNQSSRYSQLFATHPRSEDRLRRLEQQSFEHIYGSTYRTLIGGVTSGSRTRTPSSIRVEYTCPYKDKRWIERMAAETGVRPTLYENYFSKNGGQCTTFVFAFFPDFPINRRGGNDAKNWLKLATKGNWPTGNEPRAGAICVQDAWGKNSYGHVSIVTKLNDDGTYWVWDSNFSSNLDQAVRYRLVEPDDYILGYIYPPTNPFEQPKPPPPPVRLEPVLLLNRVIRLGDDDETAQIYWHDKFQLGDLSGQQTALLKFKMRAVPGKDPIATINGKVVGRFVADSPAWKWYQTEPFPVSYLRQGDNIVHLRTIVLDARDSFDECEITSVYLVVSG